MKILGIILILFCFSVSQAHESEAVCKPDSKGCQEHHGEGHDEKDHEKDKHKDDATHSEQEGHEHHDEGDDHDDHEESSQVGPDKGILEASEENGFKLSPEAIKNFKLKFQNYTGGIVTLSSNSILQTTEEKNIYRQRNGFIKRIDISVVSKSKSQVTFSSSDLTSGDQIVIDGLGFLRMAELAAFGGAPEGHSH